MWKDIIKEQTSICIFGELEHFVCTRVSGWMFSSFRVQYQVPGIHTIEILLPLLGPSFFDGGQIFMTEILSPASAQRKGCVWAVAGKF
jgi:hypothetical protein